MVTGLLRQGYAGQASRAVALQGPALRGCPGRLSGTIDRSARSNFWCRLAPKRGCARPRFACVAITRSRH